MTGMHYQVVPVLDTDATTQYALDGEVGRRLAAVTEQWLLPAPHANPGMLAMFHERDRLPLRNMVPWAGEFAGKYLTHATQILALTRNPRLADHLRWFVGKLRAGQDEDGYLGPWPRAFRLGLAGAPPNSSGVVWDAWGHYHAMLGLLKWHDLTDDAHALAAARRIADLLCATFLRTGRRLHEVGAHEMNMAPYHALLLLYGKIGESRYRELADEIERDFETPPAGDYVRTALRGMEFHQTPKPRWESLHAIQGIAEKYFLTGDAQYRQAFEHLWWSMLKGDRHNNGGFTSGERTTGNPCDAGAIETCCTVAWTAMTVDMLRLTGASVVADELELTLFNSGLGMMNPSGRWVTYDTPMEGRRWASAHSIMFQARPGTPELNCCSVNGPRMLGMIGDWALMRRGKAVVLNYYGPGTLTCTLPSGRPCRLQQVTDYPRLPRVELRVGLEAPEAFPLALRIPYWSEITAITVAGETVARAPAGQYLTLDRTWQPGDVITLEFDFRPHYWAQGPGHFYTDWEADWRVFGPALAPTGAERLAVLAACTGLPGSVNVGNRSFPARKMTSSRGELDFGCLARNQGPADTVFVFTQIDSVSDDRLPIRFCADWWSMIMVNGHIVFDGASTQFEDASLRLYCVDLPLRKGRNLVGWAITRHSNHPHWNLTVGRADPLSHLDKVPVKERFMLASIYRGPILLAFDHRFNCTDAEHLPGLDARRLQEQVVHDDTSPPAWLLLECRDTDSQALRLCDFASAGVTGNLYRTWFNVRGVAPVDFSRSSPLRSIRPCRLG